MTLGSLLFRRQPAPPAEPDPQERAARLQRLVKPLPLAESRAAAPPDDDADEYREPTPGAVLDRLAHFATRR